MKKIILITMVLCTTLSAENPNGKPGLLTISLSDGGGGITLPIFDWMTFNVSSAPVGEGYAITNLGGYSNYWEWANIDCHGDCNGSPNDYVIMENKDIIDLSKPVTSVSIDFHIQLWNK